MKKLLLLSVIFCLSVSLAACKTADPAASSNAKTEDVDVDVEQGDIAEKEEEPKEQKEQKSDEPVVSIEFLGKQYYPIDISAGNAQDYIETDFKIKNLTNKDIIGTKVKISFMDAFNEKIIDMVYRFDDTIPAGSELTTEGKGLVYNQFMKDHIKLKDADASKMSIEYEVIKVIYADELDELKTSLSHGNEIVSIDFIEKNFYPIDLTSGHVSEFLEMNFTVNNHSEKDISAVQGVIIFKNIYGDEIMRMNWSDDTTIGANSSMDIIGKGLDYNRFMNDHVLLNNTPFEKILFEFKPERILFMDGTEA